MSAAGISISFAPQIDAFARAHNLDLDQEGADSLNATLQSLMNVEGANVSFAIGKDRTGTIEDALSVYSEGTPRKGKASPAPIPVTAGSMTARALAQNAARRAPAKRAEAAEIAALGNPWSSRSINRTRQAQITNLDPQLAATLKAQAGA